ncbi:MAG: hypothetical protein AVDCRST_MAG59-3270, partial [uncultured Thermomicrobiales bacterium]
LDGAHARPPARPLRRGLATRASPRRPGPGGPPPRLARPL